MNKILLHLFLFVTAFAAYGQQQLTDIRFYQIDPRHAIEENAPKTDTFAFICQSLPAVFGQPDEKNMYDLERHIIYEDSVGRDLIRVEMKTSKSDFAKRKIDYDKQTIDGDVAYGNDGFDADKLTYIMQNYISSLSISINNKPINIDPRIYRNFFSGFVGAVLKVVDRDLIILSLGGGDGAGAYHAYLLFNSKGLVGRYTFNGDQYFKSLNDYFSKKPGFWYDIYLAYDTHPYFPAHNISRWKPGKFFSSQDSVMMFLKSADLSALMQSDTTYGDYGQQITIAGYEPFKVFVNEAKRSNSNPFQYDVKGMVKIGDALFDMKGKQVMHQARVESKSTNLVVHGAFRFELVSKTGKRSTLSGLWTYDINGYKGVEDMAAGGFRSVASGDIHKSYSGSMTNSLSKVPSLLRWGNPTVAGNWYGTPVNDQWWKR